MKSVDTIVRELEEAAESENYHDLCSIYSDLAEIITKHGGKDVARKVMAEIQNRNGFMQ